MAPVLIRRSNLAVGFLAGLCVLLPTACGDDADDSRDAGAPAVDPADCGKAYAGTWKLCPIPQNPEACPVNYLSDPEDLDAACADDLRCSYEPVPGTGTGPEPIGAGCLCQTGADGANDWSCGV